MILLDTLTVLGQGTQKIVYEHPTDPRKIIKVMKSEHATPDGGRAGQHKLRAHRSQGIYRQFRRELLQYLQLCKSHYKALTFTFPIETVYGFVATDQGLGLVTERVTSSNDQAVSIYDLVKEGMFTNKHAKALDAFFDDCSELHIVFGEVNIAGIMYTETRRGYPEFVLVDGIGEKLVIPFRAMSKTINARNVRKVEHKIKSEIDFYQRVGNHSK